MKIKDLLKKLSVTLVLLAGIFMVCLWSLLLLADIVFEDKNLSFDDHVFSLIHPYINAANTSMMETITFLGSPFFLLTANLALILFFLFIKKQQYNALKITAISITSTAVLLLLKSLLQRERPLLPLISKAHGYSFPSGHTFGSVVFYGMLAHVCYKNIRNNFLKWLVIVMLVLLTCVIGFSRIYLKLHYASDVIAGLSLGIIWLLLAKWILLRTSVMISE